MGWTVLQHFVPRTRQDLNNDIYLWAHQCPCYVEGLWAGYREEGVWDEVEGQGQ